jgi:hypothetical protein
VDRGQSACPQARDCTVQGAVKPPRRLGRLALPGVLDEDDRRRERRLEKDRQRRGRRELADEVRWRELEARGEHAWPEMHLNDNHWVVVRSHGVSEEIATAAGLRSVQKPEDRASLAEPISRRSPLPALGLPISELGLPVVRHWLLRPDEPRLSKKSGEEVKYENPARSGNPLYVLPSDRERVLISVEPLWITEGIFDALALESMGCAAIGLTAGAFGWMSQKRPHPWWRFVRLADRRVNIVFDADQTAKPIVREAAVRLEEFLLSKDALPTNIEVPGADDISDYIAKGGDPRDLLPYQPPDSRLYVLAAEIIDAMHAGTTHKLATALLADMRRQATTNSSRSMTNLAERAGVGYDSAQSFGAAIGAGTMPPFDAEGWHFWSEHLKSRIIALDEAYLLSWERDRDALMRRCAQCGGPLPPSKSTREYCSGACRTRAHRRRKRSSEASVSADVTANPIW